MVSVLLKETQINKVSLPRAFIKNNFHIIAVDAFKWAANGRKEPTFRFSEQRLTNLWALRKFVKVLKF